MAATKGSSTKPTFTLLPRKTSVTGERDRVKRRTAATGGARARSAPEEAAKLRQTRRYVTGFCSVLLNPDCIFVRICMFGHIIYVLFFGQPVSLFAFVSKSDSISLQLLWRLFKKPAMPMIPHSSTANMGRLF